MSGQTEVESNEALPPPPAGASPCVPPGLADAVALLQEKWTLMIVNVLLKGPNGFNEVGRNAGSVNSATLAQRLSRLERAGLIRKTVQSTMPPRTSYELTPAGLELKPVIDAIVAWAAKHGPFGPDEAAG